MDERTERHWRTKWRAQMRSWRVQLTWMEWTAFVLIFWLYVAIVLLILRERGVDVLGWWTVA